MPSDCIRNFMLTDLSSADSTAQIISDAFSGVYPASGLVPPYTYTSLQTQFSQLVNLPFPSLIASEYGTGVIPSSPHIVIQLTRIYDDRPAGRHTFNSDDPGAEYAHVDIFFKTVSFIKTAQTIKNLRDRVRFILDERMRGEFGLKPNIPAAGDLSIRPDYIYLFFEGTGLTAAEELYISFCCEYIRSYPTSYIS